MLHDEQIILPTEAVRDYAEHRLVLRARVALVKIEYGVSTFERCVPSGKGIDFFAVVTQEGDVGKTRRLVDPEGNVDVIKASIITDTDGKWDRNEKLVGGIRRMQIASEDFAERLFQHCSE